jgi:hypothetical protein
VTQPFTALRPFAALACGAWYAFDLLAWAPSWLPGPIRELAAWPLAARCIVALPCIAAKFALLEPAFRRSPAVVVTARAPPVIFPPWASAVVVASGAWPVVVARAALEAASFLAHRPFLTRGPFPTRRPLRCRRDDHRWCRGPLGLAPFPIEERKRCRRHINRIKPLEQRLQYRHPRRVSARRDIAADLVTHRIMR